MTSRFSFPWRRASYTPANLRRNAELWLNSTGDWVAGDKSKASISSKSASARKVKLAWMAIRKLMSEPRLRVVSMPAFSRRIVHCGNQSLGTKLQAKNVMEL